jgi:MFS family permease
VVTTTSPSAVAAQPAGSPFDRAYRAATIGTVLAMTLVAFEAMAVATAMPTAVRSLHGLGAYSWPFTAFLVTSVIGVVAGGVRCDVAGPRVPLLAGFGVFTAGLLVAGGALDMAMFVAGRAVQGVGAGLVTVSLYVLIGRVYPELLRPRVFALTAAAWVVPSLVGPVLSGLLTQYLSWRACFLCIPPLIVVGLAFLSSALRKLPEPPRRAGRGLRRIGLAVLAATGIALLQYAGTVHQLIDLLPAALGAVLLVPALRTLLPVGTGLLRRGLPATIAFRGLLAGGFFGADAFVPLALSTVHGYSPTVSGLPLMVGSFGWTAGSWFQGRRPAAPRYLFLRAGFGFVSAGTLLMVVTALPGVPGLLAVAAWAVAGTGMGLAMPSTSVLTLQLTPEVEQGNSSAALQLAEMMMSGLCVSVAGVLFAWLSPVTGPSGALAGLFGAMALVTLCGAVLAPRVRVLTVS